jgi:hypothetical protein
MLKLTLLIIALAIGFACGYGVREMKSRRNRAMAQEEYLRRQQQKIYDEHAQEFASLND